jgi:ABC-type dipeptide/oligopeptide/nickel transport system permease component
VGAYLVRRLLLSLAIVVTVSFAAFVGFGLSFDPGFPLLLGNPRGYALVESHYHLKDPILSRYWQWLTSFVRHGFGSTVSIDVGGVPVHFRSSGDPIWSVVWRSSKITAELVAAALVLVIAGSALVGTVAAERRRFRLDVSSRMVAYLAAGVPTFLIGDLIQRAFVPHVKYSFVVGHGFVGTSTGSWFVIGTPLGGFVDWLRHMTLPILALAVSLIGVYSRYLRSSMIVALHEPYTTVARAKGLPERRVVVRHALRNSLIPFTSLLSLEIGGVIGASIAVDAVFLTGGLASTFLGALAAADPFFLTALLVMTAVVVSVFAFLGDALVGLLDPRTRASTA